MHISKLGKGKRVAKVEDVVNVGDKLRVEIADISADNRGKGQKISLILVDEEGAAAADSNADAPAESETAPADAAPANS